MHISYVPISVSSDNYKPMQQDIKHIHQSRSSLCSFPVNRPSAGGNHFLISHYRLDLSVLRLHTKCIF